MKHDQGVECTTGYLYDHRCITDTEVSFSKPRESCFLNVLQNTFGKTLTIKDPQPLSANMQPLTWLHGAGSPNAEVCLLTHLSQN